LPIGGTGTYEILRPPKAGSTAASRRAVISLTSFVAWKRVKAPAGALRI